MRDDGMAGPCVGAAEQSLSPHDRDAGSQSGRRNEMAAKHSDAPLQCAASGLGPRIRRPLQGGGRGGRAAFLL